jgi:hypothetical protein
LVYRDPSSQQPFKRHFGLTACRTRLCLM